MRPYIWTGKKKKKGVGANNFSNSLGIIGDFVILYQVLQVLTLVSQLELSWRSNFAAILIDNLFSQMFPICWAQNAYRVYKPSKTFKPADVLYSIPELVKGCCSALCLSFYMPICSGGRNTDKV